MSSAAAIEADGAHANGAEEQLAGAPLAPNGREAGTELPSEWPPTRTDLSASAARPQNPVLVEETVVAPNHRWRFLPALVTTTGALALLGCALLGFLLYSERNAHADTRQDLRAALVDVSALKDDNAKLDDELQVTRELSERRAEVLRRARSVLRGVDPLLTSVDELQGLTGDMQEASATFRANSTDLVDDLVILANYLIDNNGYGVDYSYYNSLVDEINAELDTVRADAYSLDGYDSDYGGASKRFDNRASGFVNAVRSLEKQLKLVTDDSGAKN